MINFEELDNLSEEERQIALKILQEYFDEGNSKTFNKIVLSDYKETPVDIVTFIKDDKYLGKAWHLADGTCKLYPFWEEKLKELFPDPFTTSVNNFIESGARGLGKAQPLYSKILTSNGFVNMGDIKLGDKVYGDDGETHEVIGVFPQGRKKVYEVVFNDKSKTRCSDEHLWNVKKISGADYETLTLNEILNLDYTSYEIPICNKLNIPMNVYYNILDNLDSVNKVKFNVNSLGGIIIDGIPIYDNVHRIIKEINYIGEEECQCILLDSESHLYLTDDLIVTHNSEIAITVGLYLMYRLMCLKDPYGYLNLKPTEKVAFAFMNITKILAEEIGISKFQATVKASPWFMERGTITQKNNEPYWNPPDFINMIIGSQASHVIGQPIYFCLDGKTKVITDEGIFPIESLENKNIRVYTVDNEGNVVLSDYCTVKMTAESNEEYQIELEDGSVLKCTPNHRFMLKDGSYKEAQYLTEEDELADFDL